MTDRTLREISWFPRTRWGEERRDLFRWWIVNKGLCVATGLLSR